MALTSFDEAKSFSPRTANLPYLDFILDNNSITLSLSKGVAEKRSPPKITISTFSLFNEVTIFFNLVTSLLFWRLISLIKPISKFLNSSGKLLLVIVVFFIE